MDIDYFVNQQVRSLLCYAEEQRLVEPKEIVTAHVVNSRFEANLGWIVKLQILCSALVRKNDWLVADIGRKCRGLSARSMGSFVSGALTMLPKVWRLKCFVFKKSLLPKLIWCKACTILKTMKLPKEN